MTPRAAEPPDFVPEIAAGLGVDACRRFVEQKQLRLMQETRRERQALLPAARQRAGELFCTVGEAEIVEGLLDALLAVVEPVHARHKIEILADREVLIIRELLRHVADLLLDAAGVAAHVEAEAGALAFVGRQQAAEHADGGGLARAVRPKKAIDGPFGHADVEMIDHRPLAKAFGQAPHIDDGRLDHCSRPMLTGCPGRTPLCWAITASVRNTSRLRSSRE